jgi:3-phosphoglycerate kinase
MMLWYRHRAHASTTIIAQFLTAKCFGLLLAKEIESLNKVLKNSEKPVTAVLVALRFLKLRLLRIF